MSHRRSRSIASGLVVGAALACACGSSGNASGPQTCQGGFDAGGQSAGGYESVSGSGRCSTLLKGTTPPGAACTQDQQCVPTCCACPSGGGSAQVAWCNNGQCSTNNEACCAFASGETQFPSKECQ